MLRDKDIHRIVYMPDDLVFDPGYDKVTQDPMSGGIWTMFRPFEMDMVRRRWRYNHHSFTMPGSLKCRWDRIVFTTENMLNSSVEESGRSLVLSAVWTLWHEHAKAGMAKGHRVEVDIDWAGLNYDWLVISLFTEMG